MQSIFTFIRKHYIASAIVAILLLIIVIFIFYKFSSQPKYEVVKSSYKEVVEKVSVTGKVKPSSDAELAFEKAGAVARVYVDVGSQVKTGDLLVSLQSADLSADLAQAQAQLKKEEVRLANLKAGNRVEDITISQSQLDNAKAILAAADSSLINAIQDAYSKADEAVRYRADKFFYNPRSPYPSLIFSVNDSILRNDVQESRAEMEDILDNLYSQTKKISTSNDFTAQLNTITSDINKIKTFLDNLSLAVNSLTASSLSQTEIDGYKADMSAARVAIASAVSGLNTAVNTRNTAATSALTAKSQLDLQKAGSTQSDIDAQIAEVESQASLVAIKQAALSKNFLRSPIDGIVSKQDAKLGQIASGGVNIVSVISNSEFQIEANIPEASISKIQMGNLATVTLDAYQDSVKFNASIIRIDPAESIVDGVPTYKVTFEFVESDEKIRSGMTANIDIISAYKESALVIPQRAIYYDNEGSYVQVMRDGKPVLVRVEVGIRGSSGDTEILQGLSKDEEVIVNYK